MRLTPQDILDSPEITEPAILIFKSGAEILVDDLSPVQDDETDNFVADDFGYCRMVAIDEAGAVLVFDSDALESITFSPKDSAAIIGDEYVEQGASGEATLGYADSAPPMYADNGGFDEDEYIGPDADPDGYIDEADFANLVKLGLSDIDDNDGEGEEYVVGGFREDNGMPYALTVTMFDPLTGEEVEMPAELTAVLDSMFLGLGGENIPDNGFLDPSAQAGAGVGDHHARMSVEGADTWLDRS
jgi:hypothetical protein